MFRDVFFSIDVKDFVEKTVLYKCRNLKNPLKNSFFIESSSENCLNNKNAKYEKTSNFINFNFFQKSKTFHFFNHKTLQDLNANELQTKKT